MTINDELGLRTIQSPEVEAHRADERDYYTITIGLDVEADRLNHVTLGYIMRRARAEAEAAANDLYACNPRDYKRIVELQAVINRHRDLKRWLMQAISAGQAAHRALEARAAED